MFRRNFIAVFIFFASANVKAQKQLTVVYANVSDTPARLRLLLAVNDSVSFETTVYNRGQEYKPEMPLGSGFRSHNTYIDLKRNLVLWQSEPVGQGRYLINDTVKKRRWMDAAGERQILGYACKKSVAQDGENVWIAWYAPSLPVSFGPLSTIGLPGLILELTNNRFHRTFKAVEVKDEFLPITEPKKGKRITMAKFQAILKTL